MSRWHNYYVDGLVHFCTASVHSREAVLDGAAAVVYDEWEQARRALSVRVLAYVIMPNHIHLLLWAEKGDAVKQFLQRTLERSSKRIQHGGRFWKERPRVIPVHSERVLRTKLDYIHKNPVKDGFVDVPEAWPHSSFAQLELGAAAEYFGCDPCPEGLYAR